MTRFDPDWTGRLAALIAGAAFPLAFAPFGIWFLALLSIAALIVLVEHSSSREAAVRGYLYGVGMYGVGVSWVYVSISVYGGASVALSFLLVALFVMGLALIPAIQSYLYTRWLRGGISGVLVGFTALWVLQEWFRTWFLSGFPWLLAGYAFTDQVLGNWAPVAGVLGVSALVVIVAGGLALAVPALASGDGGGRRSAYVLLVGIVLLEQGTSLLDEISWVEPEGRTVKVSAIQGNVDQRTKWSPEMRRPILSLYRDLTLSLEESELIVWPEAAITLFLEDADWFFTPLDEWADARGTTLVTGILSRDPVTGGYYNAVAAMGAGEGIYRKRTLVPFGEYVPMEDLLRGVIRFFDLPMSQTLKGSARQVPLRAGDLRVSTSVCYEVVYPELVRATGATPDLLLTVSNDTWFGTSIGPDQHLQMARMRALENGRYLIRATNNGISALVDERGKVRATIPRFRRGVLTTQAQILTGETPFARFGSWPVLTLAFVGLAIQLLVRGRERAMSAPGAMG